MPFLFTIAILSAIALVVFWLWQLVSLMRMPDTTFPGRFDKIAWVAILLIAFVLGAFAFLIWKLLVQCDEESAAIARQVTNVIQQSESGHHAP